MFPDGATEAIESNVWVKKINSYSCDVGKYTVFTSFC